MPKTTPTNNCACGCGQKTWGKFVRGHRSNAFSVETPENSLENVSRETSGVADDGKAVALEAADAGSIPAPRTDPIQAPDGPPNYPEHLDRRRWRIASERPNTPVTNAWTKTQCRNCLLPMWTRDPTSTWEMGGVCEECDYILRSELQDLGVRQFRVQSRTLHDPFRPR